MSALKKILVTAGVVFVVFLMGFVSGCMTVKGLASDIGVVAGAVDRGLEPMEQSRKQARLDRAAQLVIKEKENNKLSQ